jgi:hypothetical protein
MTWETYVAVVANVRAHLGEERFSLSFSGMGEPLLNPLLPRFIAHVSAYARTSFACNGALLTERNVRALIEAGLDSIYVSFNGDEPELFEAMMGGIRFDRVHQQLRAATKLAEGSRLEIRANVSATRQTQPRLPAIRQVLEDAGVKTITYSLAHNRGGNLRDPRVCDTPPSPPDLVHCAVIEHTLFVDWRGRVFICDHDLHGEHGLGDLVTEPLREILARRQKLIDEGLRFPLCRQCNDLLKGGFEPFANGVGGILSDWIYALHAGSDQPAFSSATPSQRWILQIYQKENRLDRAVDRLLGIERELQRRLRAEQENREALRKILMEEVRNRDRRIADLEGELAIIQRMPTWQIAQWLAWCLAAMNDLAEAKRPTVQGRIGRFFWRSVPAGELAVSTV